MSRRSDASRISCIGCTGRHSVELIRCPNCQTPTRSSRRYWDGLRDATDHQRLANSSASARQRAEQAIIEVGAMLVIVALVVLIWTVWRA